MEVLVVMLIVAGLAVLGGIPVALFVRLTDQGVRLRRLEERLARLEQTSAREHPPLEPVRPPRESAPPLPEPIPLPVGPQATAPAVETAARGAAGVPAGAAEASAPPSAGPHPAAAQGRGAAAAPARRLDSEGIEQLVGSVWLQNVGSVLLLLGVFFMILWGYNTGRLGPGVLVAAGVALGLAFVWRGDAIARSVPAFGHALIGIGLGIAYLALYVGHFTLHVLAWAPAFGALMLVSFASVAVGMRYRVQTIATLGVLGAFIPQLMAAWVPLQGFALPATGLLAYFAVVDGLVFVLAARAGWSGLSLTALVLSAMVWIWAYHTPSWAWGVQIGLSALFTALGIAPLPRLVRVEGRVRPLDLAVVAFAPLGLIAASWPFLAFAPRTSVAILLLALAIVQLAAALWVDARRPERDLWRPLTGAAILYLTAALQRALGSDQTPMAWCAEGVLLVVLGLRERGGWLRFCGSVVILLGTVWMLDAFATSEWRPDLLPVFYPAGLRDLACLAAVLVGAYLLSRGRRHLTPGERFVPEAWTAVGNFLLLVWTGREASHLAASLQGAGGRWQGLPPVGVSLKAREQALEIALWGAAWMTQAFALAMLGARRGRAFLRFCAAGVGAAAVLSMVVASAYDDGWWADQLPVLHATGLLALLGIALAATVSLRLAGRREDLAPIERWMPEAWSLVASVLLLPWGAREAAHAARVLLGSGVAPGASLSSEMLVRVRTLAAAITSGAWLVEAVLLLVFGWLRGSAFLRWCGLALFGLTVLKFLLVDLQNVDVFWRFLTAIVVGVAMLAMSYAYQARTRSRAARG